MNQNRDWYKVYDEKGGQTTLQAASFEDAIEVFYAGIRSIVCHDHKICACFGEEKPLDRSKVVMPIQMVNLSTKEIRGRNIVGEWSTREKLLKCLEEDE